jgi:tetratricopeptide (TPR) repeat protein
MARPTPDIAHAYADHMIGRLANLTQDYDAAADRYFAALQRDPQSEVLLEGAVSSALAAGDMDRARQAARLAPRSGGPAYVRLVRAVDDLNAQRWRDANNELAGAEGSAAEELAARLTLVWARAPMGRAEDVVADLTPLASIRPYGGLFEYQQAMALDYAGRDSAALTAYAAAAGDDMFLPPAVERHAEALARTGSREQAIALLQREANRSNPGLQAALARLQANAAPLPQLTPSQGAAAGLYGLATIYQQEHDSSNALAVLTLALALDPQLDAARLLFAQVQSDLERPDAARTALAAIPASSPYSETARVLDSWLLVDQGHRDEALAAAQRNAASGTPRTKRALADMYRELDRYAEAEPIYSDLIAGDPQNWRFFFARGAARDHLGRWPEAEADLRHALELQPEQPDVLNYLGYSWVDRGEHLQEGMQMIRRAVELRPDSGAIIDSLGWAYFRMGDYDHAIENLEHAVELMPADATLNDHLGDAYWRAGRRIEARFQWQRALAYEPEDRAALEAKVAHGLPALPPARAAHR